jgi:DNA polymerase V
VKADPKYYQLNMFIDYEALAREKQLQGAISELRSRYGKNAIFKGNNLLSGATQLERNRQIGGHRA